MPLFTRQLFFGVLKPLAYILVVLTLIISSLRISVNFFRVSMLFEKKWSIKVKHFSEETKNAF